MPHNANCLLLKDHTIEKSVRKKVHSIPGVSGIINVIRATCVDPNVRSKQTFSYTKQKQTSLRHTTDGSQIVLIFVL